MKKIFVVSFLFVFCSAFFAEGLSTDIVKLLNKNVYEVVVKKIKEDNITYEKELPLDKLSYKERTDEYDSIGTAFFMQDGSFYTAYHVFDFDKFTQQSDYYVRSVDGKVYPVDKVLKFASDRDFVEFSVKDFSAKNEDGLKFETNYEMNSAVYSVGNAQGEGIVIRDGLLTSLTPEDRDGKWEWLRFSAAANPGNSGGPLINEKGNVVGIVVMKNSTENLNYALPVSELQKIPNNKGIIHRRGNYVFPNIIAESQLFYADGELDLPKSFKQARDEATEIMVKATKGAVATLVEKFSFTGENSFTKNIDSDLMNTDFSPSYPCLIARQDNGEWDAYRPNDMQDFKLEANGYVRQGQLVRLSMAFVQKGDNETVESMIKSPKKIMDNILKGSGLYRGVAGDKIKIHSLGEPCSSETYNDIMGRTWLVNYWEVPFCDVMVLSYSLPLPSGMFVIYKFSDTHNIKNGYCYDIPFCCDYVAPSYYGKFSEWKEYLALPKDVYPRHELLLNASLSYDAKLTEVSFGEFKGKITPDIVSVADDDYLEVGYSFYPDQKRGAVHKIQTLAFEFGKNKTEHSYAQVFKSKKLSENASKKLKDQREVIANKVAPYDEKPLEKSGNTVIFGVVGQKEETLYCAGIIKVGSHKKTIKKTYQKFVKNFGY